MVKVWNVRASHDAVTINLVTGKYGIGVSSAQMKNIFFLLPNSMNSLLLTHAFCIEENI